MAHNSQFDSIAFDELNFSYNRIQGELQEEPRLFTGTKNCYVTTGGKLARRPGTSQLIASAVTTKRVDKAIIYETLDNPPIVYLVLSLFNTGTSKWEVWYYRLNGGAFGLTNVTSYRDSNLSTAPHEFIQSRGLLFIKSFPASGSSEKLGSIVFDGTAGTPSIKPWGALGPTTPVALANSAVYGLVDLLTSTATSIRVVLKSGSAPATPFVAQIDYEQVNVTAAVLAAGIYTWTITRAFNGTVAAQHSVAAIAITRNWNASIHPVTVGQYWEYAYGYKDILNHYTNRSPRQLNPDSLPSRTGPFFMQIPQITVQGLADTTNFPIIVIYRTTDGGNTFYKLDEITNTGAGAITYSDTNLTSNSGNLDPVPDANLDTSVIAPDLNSNSPPPTVLAPKVTGTDAPQRTTPMAFYQGRIWYGIGQVLFFSSQEELGYGIPECAWPSGLFGNFFRLQYPITNMKETDDGLYIFTLKATYIVIGSDRQTFVVRPIFDNYGHPFGHPRAVTRFGETIAFLTHDYRVALIADQKVLSVSDQLFTDITTAIETNGAEFDFKYYADQDKEWLVIFGHVLATPTNSKQWIYDIKKSRILTQSEFGRSYKHFWFAPWTFPSTAAVVGRSSETSSRTKLFLFNWNTTATRGAIDLLDQAGTVATDFITANGGTESATNFDIDIFFQLIQIPAGNHVNEKRRPELSPVLYSIVLERTTFGGDTDPTVNYFIDDIWTTPVSAGTPNAPARRTQSIGYKTLEYNIETICKRMSVEILKTNSADLFELQSFWVVFEPEAGC